MPQEAYITSFSLFYGEAKFSWILLYACLWLEKTSILKWKELPSNKLNTDKSIKWTNF